MLDKLKVEQKVKFLNCFSPDFIIIWRQHTSPEDKRRPPCKDGGRSKQQEVSFPLIILIAICQFLR
jgi:hypothetical protein